MLKRKMDSLVSLIVPYSLSRECFENLNVLKAERKLYEHAIKVVNFIVASNLKLN